VTLEAVVQQYGPWAVLVGTFLEGETVLLLAAFAARSGYLSLEAIAPAAFAGALLGDQLFFYLGRLRGPALLTRHPAWEPRVARARRIVQRHERWVVLGFRFLYGLRTTLPFALGMGGLPRQRFLALNALSVAVWVSVIIGLGYGLGSAAEQVFSSVARYEGAALGAIAVVAALAWLAHELRSRAER
jgi:membrane protein DedA with SNARE-associated domain